MTLVVPHVAQVSVHSRDTVVPIPYHLVYINRQGDKHPTITDTYTYLARIQDSTGRRARRKKRSTAPTKGDTTRYSTETGRDSGQS